MYKFGLSIDFDLKSWPILYICASNLEVVFRIDNRLSVKLEIY